MNALRFVLLVTLWSAIAQATTLHVSPQPLSSIPPNQQFRTIQGAAKTAGAGDIVLIHSGVYRESVVIEQSGTPAQPITFQTSPGADVVVTGLDPLAGWQRENDRGNVYSIAWPYRFNPSSKTDAFPPDEYHRLVGRAEQVVQNDSLFRQTLQRNDVSAGSFYVDLAAKRLYVSPFGNQDLTDPNQKTQIEGSTRPVLWRCKGSYVVVRGIQFRYAANRAQQGGVIFEGRGDVAEDCAFERMNSSGAGFIAPDQAARNCRFQDNGQLGFGARRADSLLLTGCTIQNNNTKGFDRQWEAGGDKITLSRGVIIEKSRFLGNRGSGIWFDIGNENCTVRNCLIADNEDAGIFYEISYGLHAQDNVIVGNGFASTPGAWGAQAGIVLSSSPNCVITRNLIVGNREGFNFREQARITPRIDNRDEHQQQEIWNHDDKVRNNVIAYNRDAQTRGWFGVSDQRHWPLKLQEANPEHAAPPTEGISLENLHLDLSHNAYARDGDQALLIWGTNWLRHRDYSSIVAIQSDLALEKSSRVLPIRFRDFGNRDFRLPPNSAVFRMKCYPCGEVPDVMLDRQPPAF